jgi:hypothetical protein
MRIDAVENDMLLVLGIISITQVTGGGVACSKAQCVS